MGNKHHGSYNMPEEEARKEAQEWVENGGHVREDHPHKGNDSYHLHLYDTSRTEDFLINYDKGTGSENEEDHNEPSEEAQDEEKDSCDPE